MTKAVVTHQKHQQGVCLTCHWYGKGKLCLLEYFVGKRGKITKNSNYLKPVHPFARCRGWMPIANNRGETP